MISLDSNMLVSAVRYALGRHTYIVDDTNREVRRVLPELPLATLRNIHRDIKRHMGEDDVEVGYPSPPYHDTNFDFAIWDTTLRLVEQELESRTAIRPCPACGGTGVAGKMLVCSTCRGSGEES